MCSSIYLKTSIFRPVFFNALSQTPPMQIPVPFLGTPRSSFISSISCRSLSLIILPKSISNEKLIKHCEGTHIPQFRRQFRVLSNLCYLLLDRPVVNRVPPSTDSGAGTVATKFGILVPVFPASPEEGYGNTLNEWHA